MITDKEVIQVMNLPKVYQKAILSLLKAGYPTSKAIAIATSKMPK